MIPGRTEFEQLLATNLYLVIATTGEDGAPWVTPVFFAAVGIERVYWVSSPDARHSRNITGNPAVAITAFDSSVEIGRAEAAYADGEAVRAPADEIISGLRILNARVPPAKQLSVKDLVPDGPLCLYRAELKRRHILVRGGNPELRNELDVIIEV
ncbi:pyridoxamine 5'-phosphate oxidase family protein [Psychromicrobium lacuslunae]|uniref:pyridoxamine 5'-phosphate oxidase family protein n=1 Tax=Psychromicrobium lacuslunae TaxID=1618207 RepID=UPI0006972961|nr:pyridoxamine 5'-phosphate oxidase family protein [Psychromicrobium lacuslunae]